jgi:hypothetical protein
MDTNPTRLQQPSPSLALSTAKSVPSERKGTRVNRPVQHRGRAIRPGKPGTPSSISAEEEEEQQQQIILTRLHYLYVTANFQSFVCQNS